MGVVLFDRNPMENQRVLQAARLLVEAGVSVIPIKAVDLTNPKDKGKQPCLATWKEYQERIANDQELVKWFNGTSPKKGLAMIGGIVSGGLEFIDFDTEGIIDKVYDALPDDLKAIFDQMPRTETPSGCFHVSYRCSEVEGPQKLAHIVDADGKPLPHEGIETKGEGGYVVCPPSDCVHPSGKPYTLVKGYGSPLKPPVITPEQRKVILDTCRSFNEYTPPVQSLPKPREATLRPDGELRPGDDYNRHRGLVHQVLLKHGWTMVIDKGERGSEWRHPTATAATSGGLDQNDGFNVFSTNALPFEADRKPGYSPFEVYALLEHGGDFVSATRELGRQGYGNTPNPNLNGHHKNGVASVPAPAEVGSEWPEIIKIGTPMIVPFPMHALPDPLRLYFESVSRTTEVPVDLIAMSGLGVCSAAIRGRAYVQVGKTHKERLVMFIMGLMPSGFRKTEALRRLTGPIFTYQAEQRLAVEEENEKMKGERSRLRREIEKRERELKKVNIKQADAALIEAEIAKLDGFMPRPQKKPQLIADDITPESLAAIMGRAEDNSMCIMSAEGTFFLNMAGLYNGGKPNLGIALKAYDGEFLVINRKSQVGSEDGVDGGEVIINNPCLNFVTIVQPSIMRDLLNIRPFRDLGFIGRCMLAYHPNPPIGEDYPDIPIDVMAENAYNMMLFQLLGMMLAATKEDPARRLEIRLQGEALEVWAKFYADMQRRRQDELLSFDEWGAKHAGRAARIAGVLHLVKHAFDYGTLKDPISSFEDIACNTPISAETMSNAVAIAEYAIPQALAGLGIAAETPVSISAAKMLKVILRLGKSTFRVQEIAAKMHGATPDENRDNMQHLQKCHYIRQIKDQPGVFEVNPAVLIKAK